MPDKGKKEGIILDIILKEKVLEKDGCPLHYWLSDNSADVWLIFLHGAGADHRMFDKQLPAITNNFKVILMDIRGQGLSRPMGSEFSIKLVLDDILTIMGEEGCAKATFIGQSIGGNICQEMVYLYPERVESLVFIDCTCNTIKLSAFEKSMLRLAPVLLHMYPWKSLVRQSSKISALNEDVRNYIMETFNYMGKEDFIKVLIEGTKCLHSEEKYKIEHKMLLVCGEKDGTGNIRKTAPIWASREPNCEFHMINDAGHCSNQDNPEFFNKLFINFLYKQNLL